MTAPMRKPRICLLALTVSILLGGMSHALGVPKEPSAVVHRWNRIAIDASGLDHTPPPAGDPRVWGEHLGPGRASRAMAIVHVAIFDAVNAIQGGYESYTGVTAHGTPISLDA